MYLVRKSLLALVFSCLFFCSVGSVRAITDPLAVDNNKVGIHINDESDLDDAAHLVNSFGGDWGYVTVVIRANDQNQEKWQAMFNRIRELHLIPIVRIATKPEGAVWVKPQEHEVAQWVGFLNSLNWVIQNRYVILFNEPNHAKEWGGEIKPDEYARIARSFHTHLKSASEDFFVLPAGMDAAAPNGPETMNSTDYFNKMYETDKEIFTIFDGWTSHSYPNPGFVGKPSDSGKMSIRGFAWELDYLKDFGLKDNLPVFITETGWVHNEGSVKSRYYPTPYTVGNYLKTAFASAWNQDKVVAVTPFILKYQAAPFDHFSFQKLNEKSYHVHYDLMREIEKSPGKPKQISNAKGIPSYFPNALLTQSDYMIKVSFENTGQTVWNQDEFSLSVDTDLDQESFWISEVSDTKPGSINHFWVRFSTAPHEGTFKIGLQMKRGDELFGDVLVHTLETRSEEDFWTQIKLWFALLFHPTIFSTASN